MKKYKILIFIIVMIIVVPNFCFSNTVSDSVATEKQLSSSDLTIKNLEFQIDKMETYQNNLLSTVQWSIGIVVLVLIVLVSYGWYTNFKVSEKEKEIMKEQMQKYIDKEMQESKLKMQKYIIDNIDIRISQFNSSLQTIQNEFGHLKMEFQEFIADQGNAIFLYVEPLRYAIKMDLNYIIYGILEKIKKRIEDKIILDANDTSDLNEVFEELPAKYETEVRKIKTMMENK